MFVICIIDLKPIGSNNYITKYADDASLLVPEKFDINPLDAGRWSTDFAQTPYAAGSLLTDGTVYERSGW